MRITICDDQERDRARITDILTNLAKELQEDFTISEFDNQYMLFDSFKQSIPDAILLDIDMPEGN